MRTFTLPEAQTLLPVLRSLLGRAQAAASVAAAREHALSALSQAIFLSGGLRVDLPQIARIKAEQATAEAEAKDSLEEIAAIGVEVQDLAAGLLEFPYQLDDEVVMLCWRQGDSAITEWHAAGTTWHERQPLDARFLKDDRTH